MELNYSQREFLDKIFLFMKTLTIKYQKLADSQESLESEKLSRRYLLAYTRMDIFEMYYYTEPELRAAGITNPDLIFLCLQDINNIPDIYRPGLLDLKREQIVSNYVELNNYYRMLNGLPNYGEEPLKIFNGKKVTELTNKELLTYYKLVIPQLLVENPDKKYLNYLGYNKVPIYEARTAKNFYLLQYKKYILEEDYCRKFVDLYYETLLYVNRILYNPAFTEQPYYDNFISLLLVHITLQKFLGEQINFYLRRDFYDLESLKNMFLSYGLPFFEEIPVKYLRRIVKNMNYLLQYKGTNKVLIDIVNLFGFSNVEVFKYYLLKDYKKKVENGNVVPNVDYNDYYNSFDLGFVQVPLDETNNTRYIKENYLYKSYDEVVSDDPFWGEDFDPESGIDEDLKKKILDTEFNVVATKYISINTLMDMSKIIFESCYFFNMMNTLEYKNLLSEMKYFDYKIKASGEQITVFNTITAIYYLLFRRFGYDDLILYTPTQIGSVFGFDFEKNINDLILKIKESSEITLSSGVKLPYNFMKLQEDIKTLELPDYIDHKNKVIDLFINNKNFAEYLRDRILKTEDYQEYKSLSEIYKFNMYTKSVTDLYSYGENDRYDTYKNYLINEDPELWDYLQISIGDDIVENTKEMKMNNVISTLDYLLLNLEGFFNTDKFESIFISLTNVSGELVKTYMRKFISLFKSYTVELKDINIYYLFNDKFLNTVKMISFLQLTVGEYITDYLSRDYYEDLRVSDTFERIDSDLKELHDKYIYICSIYSNDEIDLSEKYNIEVLMKEVDRITLDFLEQTWNLVEMYDREKLFKELFEMSLIISSRIEESKLEYQERLNKEIREFSSEYILKDNLLNIENEMSMKYDIPEFYEEFKIISNE